MTNEKLTKAIEATAKNPRSSTLALTVVYASHVATLREAAQQVLDQRKRFEALGPELLEAMRRVVDNRGKYDYQAEMIARLLHVIEGDAS